MNITKQADETAIAKSFASLGFVKVQCYDSLDAELRYLRKLLQNAMVLEHATIPPYLTMLYTLGEQESWQVKEAIRSVVVEEMLHFVLAANVLNGIGGTPNVSDPDFLVDYPASLPYAIDDIKINLLGFSKKAVAQGLAIERPKYIRPHVVALQHVHDMTIGEFYAYIEGRLRAAVDQFGEKAIFCGDSSNQVPPHAFYYEGGGDVVVVTDLKSAVAALQLIRDQGEGSHHTEWTGKASEAGGGFKEVAHYFRFNEIKEERLYKEGDTVESGPTGEAIVVDWHNGVKVPENVKLWDYPSGEVKEAVYAFNQRYCELLKELQQSLTGQPEKLLPAVVAMCSLRNDFSAITANPFPGRPGYHSVPTFEYVAPRQDKPASETPSQPAGKCPFSGKGKKAGGSVEDTLNQMQNAYSTGNLSLALSCLSDDVIWDISGPNEVPYAGVFYGHDGFSRFWTLLNSTIKFGSAGIDKTFIDGLQAMVYGGEQGSTLSTGAPYHYDWAIRYQLDASFKITLMRQYFDPGRIQAALKASPYKTS